MRPAKKSNVVDNTLVQNTLSIRRRYSEDFNPLNKPTLKKDSKVYVMLKHGPLPDGDYSYLISNGIITRYAKWLSIACELKIPFLTLLILSRIYCAHVNSHNSDNQFITSDVLREQLYGPMGFDFKPQVIINMITTLKKLGYCNLGVWRSLRGVPHIMDKLEKRYDYELKELSEYFDDTFQSNIYNEV